MRSFRKAGRGGRVVREKLFILGGGGGSGSRQVAPGHPFTRIVRRARRTGNQVPFKRKCLLAPCRYRSGVGLEDCI